MKLYNYYNMNGIEIETLNNTKKCFYCGNNKPAIGNQYDYTVRAREGSGRRKGPKKYAADRGQNALKTATAPLGVA